MDYSLIVVRNKLDLLYNKIKIFVCELNFYFKYIFFKV